ncbi:hypothetical protein CR513_03799, partial [Mucuna pruriens]
MYSPASAFRGYTTPSWYGGIGAAVPGRDLWPWPASLPPNLHRTSGWLPCTPSPPFTFLNLPGLTSFVRKAPNEPVEGSKVLREISRSCLCLTLRVYFLVARSFDVFVAGTFDFQSLGLVLLKAQPVGSSSSKDGEDEEEVVPKSRIIIIANLLDNRKNTLIIILGQIQTKPISISQLSDSEYDVFFNKNLLNGYILIDLVQQCGTPNLSC